MGNRSAITHLLLRRQAGRWLGHRATAAALALLAIGLLAALLSPFPAAADPIDQLIQTTTLQLTPTRAEITISMTGGILANERVLYDLDPNHAPAVTQQQLHTWAALFLSDFHVSLDNKPVPLTTADLQLTMPSVNDFHLGLNPLVVKLHVTLPKTATGTAHSLALRNDYIQERTTHILKVETADGVKLTSQPLPSRISRLAFTIDPAATGTKSKSSDSSTIWGGSGVIGHAKRVLERPKTPALLITLIGVFLVMGALHALSPGHGKTLVAAYLVATGGTWRDAVTLAAIVTFTHTISVFILGGATLAASSFFLPSRVVPVLSWVSGLLVAGMGLFMLRGSIHRVRRLPAADTHASSHHHDPGLTSPPRLAFATGIVAGDRAHVTEHHEPHHHAGLTEEDPAHLHQEEALAHHIHHHDHAHLTEEEHTRLHAAEAAAGHGHDHHHHHDHANLSDEEHARLHLAELAQARGADGRGVSLRGLVTLGVSGGITPCPDALAILLLAVGINQIALGMMAIFAFSIGLAAVLVAFGLTIALAGPFWRRLGQRSGDRLGFDLARLAQYTPIFSASIVLILGLIMLWRSTKLF